MNTFFTTKYTKNMFLWFVCFVAKNSFIPSTYELTHFYGRVRIKSRMSELIISGSSPTTQ
jgi:hypothetical protein